MAWTLHLQPIQNPWADAAMLTGGRAMYVAQAFEEKGAIHLTAPAVASFDAA
jgi:hypothetical protein